ncbi:MAG: prolipoprotein diacylglyceryl transferase [Deltaproteobacteria bacterium]|nr:prolipoprotein diacylglyceryl transferase [Deltaproteobacteria bacterium]
MYPILFKWGTFLVPAWHTFFLLGALASFVAFRRLTMKYQPKLLTCVGPVYFYGYLGGLVGARLLSIVVEEDDPNLTQMMSLDSFTLFGGVLGGFAFASLYVWFKNLPFAKLWDLAVPSFLLGLAIGRIGCFLNGDDYGIEVFPDAEGKFPWWAVVFPNHPVMVPRVPVQLVEAGGVAILFVLIVVMFKRVQKLGKGLVGSLSLAAYCGLRFCLEFLRGDPRGFFFGTALSTSQGIAIAIFLMLAGVWSWRASH